MADTSTSRDAENGGVLPYATSWEHLHNELKCLDLLIRRQLLRQKQSATGPFEQFRGLVLSEEEIVGLLASMANTVGDQLGEEAADSDERALSALLEQAKREVQKRRATSPIERVQLSLPRLAQLFRLSPFEEQCVLICLAPEVDRRYERLYAYLQDDVTRKKPSVDLIINLLCGTWLEKLSARSAFESQAPLVKYGLVHVLDNSPEGPNPLLSRFLKLDDRIVDFLLDFGGFDARLRSSVRSSHCHGSWEQLPVARSVAARMRDFVTLQMNSTQTSLLNAVFYFHGPHGSGRESLADTVCSDLGLPLLIADVRKMLQAPIGFEEAMWLTGRETALQPAALCLENFDVLFADEERHLSKLGFVFKAIQAFPCLTFLLGERPWKPQRLPDSRIFLDLELPMPSDSERKHLWEGSLSNNGRMPAGIDAGALASKFRFTPGQMRDALAAAENLARWRSPDELRIEPAELYAACRAQSAQKLGTLARKIEPRYTWDDIVLPADALEQLREICLRVAARQRVLGEWGFDRKLSVGKGVNALFAGPSGTGKTMAAEIIAAELALDLYSIDLSGVVSKYIGETEKNLDQIFTTAESSNAILFFDEADALFGKRSEVRDSHDRYANIEIAYLLQKMDQYEGVAILATNLRQNMDEAFTRRLQFIVEFPFPDESYRRQIWEVMFPPEAPLQADIDLDFLARQFRLAGGNIKNIALGAAFLGAAEGDRISMDHLIRATWRECRKLGRALGSSDFGRYAEIIR
jgi:Winged helix domain, variant/ATPase family associated with various cellular activities (AAA)